MHECSNLPFHLTNKISSNTVFNEVTSNLAYQLVQLVQMKSSHFDVDSNETCSFVLRNCFTDLMLDTCAFRQYGKHDSQLEMITCSVAQYVISI